jgi:hypothetical protein
MGQRRSGVGITRLSSSAPTLACSASISRLVICAHSLLAQFAAQRLAQPGDRLHRLVVDGLAGQAPQPGPTNLIVQGIPSGPWSLGLLTVVLSFEADFGSRRAWSMVSVM